MASKKEAFVAEFAEALEYLPHVREIILNNTSNIVDVVGACVQVLTSPLELVVDKKLFANRVVDLIGEWACPEMGTVEGYALGYVLRRLTDEVPMILPSLFSAYVKVSKKHLTKRQSAV